MPEDIDGLFDQIRSLADQLDRLPASDPNRPRLETHRDQLRKRAATLADAGRHPDSVARQIEALEHRQSEIEAMFIKKGYSERSTTRKIQDPGAYSRNINALIHSEYGAELEQITQQLERLRKIAPPSGATSGSG